MTAHQLTMKGPVLSAQKALQFEVDNPVVVKGKKRGTFDHITFHERFSKKTYSSDETMGKWMDFIEYSRKMERQRGWSVGQSKAKWNWFLARPGIKTDMKGEEKGFEQRILCPKGDYSRVGTMSAEEKAIEIVSKRQKSISTEAWKDALGSLGAGHGAISTDSHSAAASDSAVIFGSGVCASFGKSGSIPNMLETAHGAAMVPPSLSPVKSAEIGGDAPVGESNGAVEDSPGKVPDVVNQDIANLRLPTFRKWETAAIATRKKLASDFAAGHVLLQMDFV